MSELQPHAAARELLARRNAVESLVDYARYIEVPGAPLVINEDGTEDENAEDFQPIETEVAAHHELILRAAQRCMTTRYGRLMVFMPPGSAKSTYASVVAPSWYVGKFPRSRLIAASYATDLAKKMGRRIRSILRQPAYANLFETGLNGEQSAADSWALLNGSEYMAAGMTSGITGNRAWGAIVDDPIKGREAADSELQLKKVLEAYEDDLKTRLIPGGWIILIMTRWSMGDLAGVILPEDYDGRSGKVMCRDGMEWEIINLPAQCERSDDPLGRKPGEYLWTQWFDAKHWEQFKRNPRTWNALFQQRPAPDEGTFFKREWFKPIARASIPPIGRLSVYGGSDYAVTSDGGDYTVHVDIGIDEAGRFYLLDAWRKQASSDVWVEAFCDIVIANRPIGWGEESGQITSAMGPIISRRQRERKAWVARTTFATKGDKAVRAQSIRGLAALYGIYYPEDADWWPAMFAELMQFPAGAHDDTVDALGLAGQLIDKMWKPEAIAPKSAPLRPDYKSAYETQHPGDWKAY